MFIKELAKRIIYGNEYSSDSLVNYLRNNGAIIGHDVNIYSMRKANIDKLNPHLLTIGNNVNIVGFTLLMHDYSWSVIKGMNGEILGNQKPITIGSNVFIGDGCVLLCGSNIGDNVIIGACSVVSGDLDSNSVYAGNPAKKIMSIEEYVEKRKKRQIEEARYFVREYRKRNHKDPDINLLHEYFFLFQNTEEKLTDCFRNKLRLCGNYEMSLECYLSHKPAYESYEEFLKDCDE